MKLIQSWFNPLPLAPDLTLQYWRMTSVSRFNGETLNLAVEIKVSKLMISNYSKSYQVLQHHTRDMQPLVQSGAGRTVNGLFELILNETAEYDTIFNQNKWNNYSFSNKNMAWKNVLQQCTLSLNAFIIMIKKLNHAAFSFQSNVLGIYK